MTILKLDETNLSTLWKSPYVLASLLALVLAAFSFSSAVDPTQAAFYWLGNVSFMLTFFAFWQRSLIKLRILAAISLVIGLVYNTYVHLNMPEGQNLWLVLFWMVVFLGVNIYRSWSAISASIERSLSAAQRPIQAVAFPESHSADWVALMGIATSTTYEKGATVIDLGDSTPALMILSVGTAEEQTPGDEPVGRSVGTMWGELTWAMGAECYNESPCRIVVTSQHATVLELPYEALSKLTDNNPRLRLAILDGIVRDQARKKTRPRLDYAVLNTEADFSEIKLMAA